MNPHEAISLVTKLEQLFPGITPAQRHVLETMLEPFPHDTAEEVIARYAQESSNLDRGKLRTLLLEEYQRRVPRVSSTVSWKKTMEAELKERDELLSRTPKRRLQSALEDVRQKPVSRFLPADPLETDFGKWLIFNELRGRKAS